MHIKPKNDVGGYKHLARFWSCEKVVVTSVESVSVLSVRYSKAVLQCSLGTRLPTQRERVWYSIASFPGSSPAAFFIYMQRFSGCLTKIRSRNWHMRVSMSY